MNAKISVIMLSYNKQELLIATLKSLLEKMSGSLHEVIVVENGSTENNEEVLRNSGLDIKIVVAERNLGFAGGCNLGAKHATGDYLLFLNSDMLFEEDPIPGILEIIEKNPETGIVGYQLLNSDGSLQPSYYRFPGLKMRLIQLSGIKKLLLKFLPKVQPRREKFFCADYVSGAFLFIPRTLFTKLGGFEEMFFMYQEDADLCFRAKKAGMKTIVFNGKKIYHLNENHEAISNEFVFRNMNTGQIIFYKKHFGTSALLLLTVMTFFFYGIHFLFLKIFRPRKRQETMNLKSAMGLYLTALKNN